MRKVNSTPKPKKPTPMHYALARISQAVAPTSQTIDYIAEGFGKHDFIRAMRLCSKDTQIMEALQIYDHLPEDDRNKVSLDLLCAQVGMEPEKLCSIVCSELVKVNGQTLKMIVSTATPAVLRAGVAAASTPEGLEDRRMIYQMSGLMPFDKSGDININNNLAGLKGMPRFEDAADAAETIIIPGEVVNEAE